MTFDNGGLIVLEISEVSKSDKFDLRTFTSVSHGLKIHKALFDTVYIRMRLTLDSGLQSRKYCIFSQPLIVHFLRIIIETLDINSEIKAFLDFNILMNQLCLVFFWFKLLIRIAIFDVFLMLLQTMYLQIGTSFDSYVSGS